MSLIENKTSDISIQLDDSELLGWAQVAEISDGAETEGTKKSLGRLLNKRGDTMGEMPPGGKSSS